MISWKKLFFLSLLISLAQMKAEEECRAKKKPIMKTDCSQYDDSFVGKKCCLTFYKETFKKTGEVKVERQICEIYNKDVYDNTGVFISKAIDEIITRNPEINIVYTIECFSYSLKIYLPGLILLLLI